MILVFAIRTLPTVVPPNSGMSYGPNKQTRLLESRAWTGLENAGLTFAVFTAPRVPAHRRKDPQSWNES